MLAFRPVCDGMNGETFSIGEAAEATGVSVHTIRVWERRYGRPRSFRLASGHRRYDAGQVCWLRRAAEALALGHRPSLVALMSDAELSCLLENPTRGPEVSEELRHLLDLIRDYQAEELAAALQRSEEELGARRLITERIAPLLCTVGRLWADGEFEVRHEHVLSEVVDTHLRGLCARTAAGDGAGPIVILTTLSGELHGLGLRMAAVACLLRHWYPVVLGTETPCSEIVEAAIETGARAVGISVSLATGGVETDRALSELRKHLPDAVEMIVGGLGARGIRRGLRGVHYASTLEELEEWLADRLQPAAPADS